MLRALYFLACLTDTGREGDKTMLSRKTSRIIASAMLVLALAFLAFAFTHPEAGFPWSNSVTYFIYAVYGAVMVLLFAAPRRK